ncbi:uncharacterized protein LOC116345337 [Contarinia nasturtii]|uniref:uncharacterized protein LOC116345337 n=1 Tax=Contarinia nasturtii TaxID=265458 RepID=UPI0012D3CD16|nr:uncharacterized protein LOC116345337 [Contarinia nasturtii]XP_031630467.1 uncharacterized protein LOC116345337 [Contarinia nasturtii]
MHRMQQHFGKRKFGGSHNASEFYTSPKNQRLRPCRDIVYTEDAIPVRKLYFSVPSAEITKMSLKKHFMMFGAIDSFTLHLKLSYCYGFIQYKSVHSAAAALKNQHPYVCGFRIKVSVADSWHQPITTQQDMATQNNDENAVDDDNGSETGVDPKLVQVLDLNDDCLYDIFNMLNCIDLSAVDQTCLRFQKVAGDVFRKKHTAINLTMTNLPGYSNVGTSQLTLLQIRNLFIGYGPQIRKLQVAALSFKQENRYRVLDSIIRTCTGLESLSLTGFIIKESLYRINNTFFSNLEELSLSLCELNDNIRRVFLQCNQLKKLTIQSDSNLTGSCLAIQFPNLESITLIMNSDIEMRHLNTFFKLNRQLKSVKIIHCGGCIFDEIFPRIATNLPELEALTIEVDYFQNFCKNIMALLRLENLRELQLNCSMYSVSTFIEGLAAKGKIEVLHLSDGLLNDGLIDAIAKCKKLTSLKLCSMPSVHNRFLAELAKNLPQLNDFHISKCQTLNSSGVVHFATLAKKLKTLHINNSSVEIDDKFFQSLATVFKERGTRLTLSLCKMQSRVTPEIYEEHKQHIQIVRSNDFLLYDIFGEDLSDIDSDDDDDDDSDFENWDDYDSYGDDPFDDDDEYSELFDFNFNPNQWNFLLD